MKKNLLVPLRATHTDLKSVQHALALARRIPVRVFILLVDSAEGAAVPAGGQDAVLPELIAAARQVGLPVTFHTTTGAFEREVVRFVERERVHLLVLGDAEAGLDRLLLERSVEEPPQIILVKEKVGCAAIRSPRVGRAPSRARRRGEGAGGGRETIDVQKEETK